MKVGQVLGHYHVIRSLGQGGMGAVYEASDTRLNRPVALKVLPAKMANNPEWLKRFEREAQAIAALNHPNIVTIHSVEEADDVHFITLEYVGGKTLDALIPEGGLPLETIFEVAIPLADAIAAAHKRGIAHRDLKPSNVMVDEEGRVKVLDFGIAKLLETVPDDEVATQIGSEALTEEGKIVGTVAYMAPEQAEGRPADQRSDIFSLGIILYEMATGARPFTGDTKLSLLASIVKDDPVPIIEHKAALPRHLARIVKKALEKSLERRYQSMLELRNDLIELKEEIDAGEPLLTGELLTDPGALEAYRREPERVAWGKWVGVAGVVVALAALGWALFWRGGEAGGAAGPPALTMSQLTTATGLDFGGTISPDGEWFAFARQDDDGTAIYLQSVGSRSAIQINANGVSPAFSHDGARIAFSGPAPSSTDLRIGGGIYVMGRTGDDVRKLTETGFNPTWSPDGGEIAYAGEFVSSRPYSRTVQGSKLRIVDVDTGSDRALEHVIDAVQPHWSPHGNRIAYWAIEGGQRDLWTIDAAGEGDPVQVTDDPAIDYSPTWSPEGDWLYFASTRGGPMAIWRVAIDEQSGRPRGEPQQVTTGGQSEPGMLSFSADGSRLLYTETLILGSIAAADFDPRRLALTSEPTPVVSGTRRLLNPAVSPTGEWLAYRNEGGRQDIFVARTDGTDEQQITDDLAKDWVPRWSPDEERIAYYSNLTGSYEVWVVNRDGSHPTRLTDWPEETLLEPTWSPDGTRIVFSVRGIGSFFIDPNVSFENQTQEPLPAVPGGLVFRAKDWSARGGIVGEVDPAEGEEPVTVWVFHVDSGEYEYLADGTGPRWMNDGRRVLFRVPEPVGFFVVDSVTKEIVPVDVPAAEDIRLSPDNRRAYLNQETAESDIWMLEIH